MFPDEFKNDLTWALGLDKIIRQNVIQLKNNKFNSFDKLCSSVAKNYRILKCQRDAQLTKEWLGKLSPRDRKIAKHLYYVSFYPDKVNMRKINKFFALESTTPKEGEILSSYNFDLLNKEELVYLFTSDRVKNGIDRYGTFGFGVPRPINDPDNHGTIIVKQVEKAALGNRILGRKFINYVNQYENPEVIKTLGEPKKINIKEWESKDNPISSIIRKKDLPSEENQNLLVYTRNKPSELGDFPICSTAVIFSETGGKKPILTSVVWDMQSMEKFPVVQN
ncbi:MAG: hypothetical protein GX568_10445, partial [Candidatus Gastranaerophilales bacterium]|nr:hypothetical protein [Candidatus Gastranaerophilales bacterium]